jgi:hypothetical protein
MMPTKVTRSAADAVEWIVRATCASPKLDSPVFSTTSLVNLPTTIFQIKFRT